ncbi:unnamed protein product [Meganyctiphanes norvegica]|uniref:Peptidase aspartic putative domain-containing protein n=1 Tax=Meganyctiphanes norvegica TaxID=48144 RepID=A0AAV2S5B2_MEGNR
MSLSPTIIIPLRGSQNNSVRVRTLLDPGSGTNWIVKDLLDKVQFTKKGQENLEVVTFSGTVKKKFQLVEVYYLDESQIKQSLICYVYEVYTRHITVKGMLQYIINNAQEQSVLFKKYEGSCVISCRPQKTRYRHDLVLFQHQQAKSQGKHCPYP